MEGSLRGLGCRVLGPLPAHHFSATNIATRGLPGSVYWILAERGMCRAVGFVLRAVVDRGHWNPDDFHVAIRDFP